MTIYEKMESGVRSYCRSLSAELKSGHGSIIVDKDDNEYIDFLMGCGSLNYGHNDPFIKSCLIKHIEKDGLSLSLDFHSEEKNFFLLALRDNILKPRGLDYKVHFTGPTGTNAVEAAIKIARKNTGRKNIVSFTNGFHGCSLGALSITGNKYQRKGAGISLSECQRLPYEGYEFTNGIDHLKYFEKCLEDPSSGIDLPAAIILECIQGEGGLNTESKIWLKEIRKISDKHGIILIFDEIQSGCGRSGDSFSFEESGVIPDIITLAKSLSGFGLPMSMVLLKPELDKLGPAEHNGTFRGNNHAFVTAAATINKYWKNNEFSKEIKIKSKYLIKWCADCLDQYTKIETSVEDIKYNKIDDFFIIKTNKDEYYETKNLVLGTGREIKIPKIIENCESDLVFHFTRYKTKIKNIIENGGKKIAIVGSSQTIAELVLHVTKTYPEVELDIIMRRFAFPLKDTSPFMSEIYFPSCTKFYYNAAPDLKKRIDKDVYRTNYGAADMDVIEEIYRQMYYDTLNGTNKINMLRLSDIVQAKEISNQIKLTIKDNIINETIEKKYDGVICATGFYNFGSQESEIKIPNILKNITPILNLKEQAINIEEDYSLSMNEGTKCNIFMNGLSEASHGMGDALCVNLLSDKASLR